MPITKAYLNRIANAVYKRDVHDVFVIFAEQLLAGRWLRTAKTMRFHGV